MQYILIHKLWRIYYTLDFQMDIDDFKFINDGYGHSVGDMALKTLAQSIKDCFAENAVLCRNGGDEFSVVLIGITAEKAKEKIEKFTLKPRCFTYSNL